MKRLIALSALLLLSAGCGPEREAPLVTGSLKGGFFWKNPQGSPNNEGGSY